ncbi:hypothetical protein D3C80_1499970 [compost metagenome]
MVRLPSTVTVLSFSTEIFISFSACSCTISEPALSSKNRWLELSLWPSLERVIKPIMVAPAGSVHGGIQASLYTRPVTIGRSGSPLIKSITTSSPTRGICTPPKPWPAQALDTRTQQELLSSPFARRSQWNFTFTRPYLSVQIDSP